MAVGRYKNLPEDVQLDSLDCRRRAYRLLANGYDTVELRIYKRSKIIILQAWIEAHDCEKHMSPQGAPCFSIFPSQFSINRYSDDVQCTTSEFDLLYASLLPVHIRLHASIWMVNGIAVNRIIRHQQY